MRDKELIELRNRLIIGIIVSLLFVSLLTIFFINKLTPQDTPVIKSINNKENIIILVISNNCKNCKDIKKITNNLKIKHFLINKDKNSVEYDKILVKLNISSSDIVTPSIIYVEKGKLKSSLVEIKDEEELQLFIENYNLGK